MKFGSLILIAIALLFNGCDGDLKKENTDLKLQIEALTTAKTKLEIDLESQNEQLKKLQNQLVDADAKIVDLSGKVLANENENASINEQLSTLKKQLDAQKANAVTMVNNKNASAYDNFMSVARRMVAACETGISYKDYQTRYVDLLASAEEAYPGINDPVVKNKILDFMSAIDDAYSMWTYLNSFSEVGDLKVEGVENAYYLPPAPGLNGNWRNNSTELIKKYKLSVTVLLKNLNVTPGKEIVPKILGYAENEFSTLGNNN